MSCLEPVHEMKGKKKKHKNNDDGFEARSQFNAYYPQVQYQPASYDPNANAPAYYSSPLCRAARTSDRTA